MGGRKMEKSLVKLAILFFSLLLALLLSVTPVDAFNIGLQSVSPDLSVSEQQCSRKCESQHLNVPPFLRYGRYCGILYTRCPGEKPCDALDACCMVHDACVQSKNNDSLSQECNENHLSCLAEARDSRKVTLKGNRCMVEVEVAADVNTLVMEAVLWLEGFFTILRERERERERKISLCSWASKYILRD